MCVCVCVGEWERGTKSGCVASHLLTMACTSFVKVVETSRLVPGMLQKLPIILFFYAEIIYLLFS